MSQVTQILIFRFFNFFLVKLNKKKNPHSLGLIKDIKDLTSFWGGIPLSPLNTFEDDLRFQSFGDVDILLSTSSMNLDSFHPQALLSRQARSVQPALMQQ